MAEQGKPALLMSEVVKEAANLREKRKEVDNLRRADVAQWAQNRAFYLGHQWVYWNQTGNRLETIGTDPSTMPRYKVRLTSNVILPAVQQLVAQMTKTRPTIRAVPDSGANRDVKAAEMAERLFEYWWDSLGLDAKLMSAMTNAQISGGYWVLSWDALAGKSMKVMMDPQSQSPIWDEELADGFRDDVRQIAEQLGIAYNELIPMFEQTFYVGDVDVKVLAAENVWLDPTKNNWQDCEWVICKYAMSVDEVQARFKKKGITANANTSDQKPAIQYTAGKTGAEDMPPNVREVFYLYHRPTASMPRGKVVAWIEDPNEILFQSDWDLPFNQLPVVKFPGIERPGSVLDEARITHARPIQKEINTTISGIAMHKNLTMKPQMIAPVGSLRQKLSDEPGVVLEYNPIQGNVPEWRQIPALPAYVFEHLGQMQARIDRLFNIMPTERGQLPARTDSGQLVELVQEAVADQLAPEIRRMEDALARAGDILVAFAQKYYAEPRLLRIKGPGGGMQVRKFMNQDLAGGFGFQAEAGSGLPRTRAGQFQQIKEMMELGVIDAREALQYMPVAGLKGIQQRLQADEEFAQRRVDKLLKGQPANIPAMQQAIQHVQTQGTNPMTGEFFASQEEAIAFVEQQSMTPLPHENAQVTLYVVGQFMKQQNFDEYPLEVQDHFYKHYAALKQATEQRPMGEPVKTTLSLKGTVGPTVAADILQGSGVQSANPETMAEQPLETSVYDSVDKPDADEAGNDPLSEVEQAMLIDQQATLHAQRMATANLKTAQANDLHAEKLASSRQQNVDVALKRVRDEEIHQERLRQMKRDTDNDGGA